MIASNALEDKIPIFVIGRSLNPHCFKEIKNNPCRYCPQVKAWMNSDIFEKWVCKLYRKFKLENRKTALIIDNCPAHPHVNDLKAIELVFLPKCNLVTEIEIQIFIS